VSERLGTCRVQVTALHGAAMMSPVLAKQELDQCSTERSSHTVQLIHDRLGLHEIRLVHLFDLNCSQPFQGCLHDTLAQHRFQPILIEVAVSRGLDSAGGSLSGHACLPGNSLQALMP